MCGRYYVDDEMEQEIEKILRKIDAGHAENMLSQKLRIGDYYPTQEALVIGKEPEYMNWGIKAFGQKTNLFNARSETVLERPAFAECVRKNRIVVPAGGFYEWNERKEKNSFKRKDGQPMFMAGCFQRTERGKEFTIITTQANESMKPVHDRMPLILEIDEIKEWIYDEDMHMIQKYLKKKPVELERKSEYEQMSLF